jgi:CRISPR-associated protein Cmr4
LVQASGLKGALRSECEKRSSDKKSVKFVFGPETAHAPDHAGALSPGDARLLLFPVRSLAGVFAWTTSVDALARFQRGAKAIGEKLTWTIPPAPAKNAAWVTAESSVVAGGKVVLEEFAFTPSEAHSQVVVAIAKGLADHALPNGSEYAYWKDKLLKSLVILHEDAFRDFTQFSVEIMTRVALDEGTKTVKEGPWTEENLPVDTLLYAPLAAVTPRRPKKDEDERPEGLRSAKSVMDFVAKPLDGKRIQLGGDETVGRGVVSLRFGPVNALNGREVAHG